MQSVVTAEQARKITKGRTPHVPVEYETACKALEACCTLEESKYWSDKADALAAWAKIFHDSKIERQAKILKLRAYARMGELARELYPKPVYNGNGGGCRGARTELAERAGMTLTAADIAIRLSRVPPEKRKEFESRPRIQSPSTAVNHATGPDNKAANALWALTSFASTCRSASPGEVKKYAATHLHCKLLENAEEVYDWLGLLLGKD